MDSAGGSGRGSRGGAGFCSDFGATIGTRGAATSGSAGEVGTDSMYASRGREPARSLLKRSAKISAADGSCDAGMSPSGPVRGAGVWMRSVSITTLLGRASFSTAAIAAALSPLSFELAVGATGRSVSLADENWNMDLIT